MYTPKRLSDMNQEILIESNEEVEEMQCSEVEELFGQLKSIKLNF